jgi:hypothetical protein
MKTEIIGWLQILLMTDLSNNISSIFGIGNERLAEIVHVLTMLQENQ